MGRGKRKSGSRYLSSDSQTRMREHLRKLDLQLYEVGGVVRDELRGNGHLVKDIDVAVCGLTYNQLAAKLEPHGFVSPNIVGGGKLGLRVFDGNNNEGKLLKPEKKETWRQFYRRAKALGCVEPEVYDGVGRLVGCRLQASWTPSEGIEISLARTEKSTAPGRANFAVETGPDVTILQDLARRDFTINAIARDLKTGELIDPFDGEKDIKEGILRVIGPDSFLEDPSRIIRGLVRIAKDDLNPDAYTLEQMQLHVEGLLAEPAEQIWGDLEKLLQGQHAAKALRIARDCGILTNPAVLPELVSIIGFEQRSLYHDLTADEHTFRAVDIACQRNASIAVRVAALLHDSAKGEVAWSPVGDEKGEVLHYYSAWSDKKDMKVVCPQCRRVVILKANSDTREIDGEGDLCSHCAGVYFARDHALAGADKTRKALLRFKQPPTELIEKVELLTREHMFHDDMKETPLSARRFIKRVGRDNVEDLLALRQADRRAKASKFSPEDATKLKRWEKLVQSQIDMPLYPKELAVSGHDAMRFGFQGPQVGAALKDLAKGVIDTPEANTRERLLLWLARRAVKERLLSQDEADALVEEL